MDRLSRSWLGTVGGILAIVGVIAAPVTSGDTALRSARLVVADIFNLPQKKILNRFIIAIPLFLCVFGLLFVDFNVVWRYFAWTNQTMAVFTLWAATLFLYKQEWKLESGRLEKKRYPLGYLITLVPALFMTMVSMSYILIAPEGLNLSVEHRWIGYLIAGLVTLGCLVGFVCGRKRTLTNA